MSFFHEQEQKRIEKKRHSEHLIWFQRCERDPTMTAEIGIVNDKMRWRIFTNASFEPAHEGNEASISEAMAQVFKIFKG